MRADDTCHKKYLAGNFKLTIENNLRKLNRFKLFY
jgi:hypothetical protein